MKKIILDLCGGTGSWSRPYKEAGYEVHNITLPKFNVLYTAFDKEYHLINFAGKLILDAKDIYGILSAPPCTYFSYARTNAKKPRDLDGAFEIVHACLKVVWFCQQFLDKDTQKYPALNFWVLENPRFGMLSWYLGKPAYEFDPWEFGDAYKKRTALWGYFTHPEKQFDHIEQVLTKEQIEKHKTNSQPLPKFDYMKSKDIHPEHFGKLDRQTRRAITPKGFAEAFFKANNKEILDNIDAL